MCTGVVATAHLTGVQTRPTLACSAGIRGRFLNPEVRDRIRELHRRLRPPV